MYVGVCVVRFPKSRGYGVVRDLGFKGRGCSGSEVQDRGVYQASP